MNGRALLAWNLRRIRVSKGLSQEKLAADAGVDRAYFAKLERQTANAGVDVLDKLAGALSVELSEFFARPPEGAAPPTTLPGGRKKAN
ncbi:helix-turn-helix domain-containing protein [Sinorhizobium medicae]|uniref:Transcriptional regulator n=1 Tax=Sinorhizobium medicae TaxID=110321 RepID=A0ABX4TF88_9HYPH|nr:helix-turn-helix transcriptional regulator [Sinorhizobium medicae]PLT97188.1 transcriptional regulator [Sinorhizobium medicae]PLU23630.1 transcriptional regulator [Sinorhizobium medicae]PLU79514.1 transcriptional regulator [Sinorhizobium medicae]